MLQSMTGYGKAECLVRNKKFIIEIKSLNSKQADINTRITNELRDRELSIRAILTQELERGKIDLTITTEQPGSDATSATPVNLNALDYYMRTLTDYATAHGLSTDHIFGIAVRMPDVMKTQEQGELDDNEWQTIKETLMIAIGRFKEFRKQEGLALQKMFTSKLNGISDLLRQVEPLEGERIARIKSRLEDNLSVLSQQTGQAIDRNRLEQEMIYYLEKLDITEEKVRLRNHIAYFFTTMEESGQGVGKKLGFVAQEMGREINTLGSKSNQSEMQIIVVKMKDLLEQIKEQVLNVL